MNVESIRNAISLREGKEILVDREIIEFLIEENDKLASYARHTAKISARAIEKHMKYEKVIRQAIDQVQSGSYVEEVVYTLTSVLDEYQNEVE